jgi:hypothetical protein
MRPVVPTGAARSGQEEARSLQLGPPSARGPERRVAARSRPKPCSWKEGRRIKHLRRANGELWDLIEMGLLL